MPVIANLAITDAGFSFDIERIPPVSKYDVWLGADAGVKNPKKAGQYWYVGSIAVRRGTKAPREASFPLDVASLLRFERKGTYGVTAYLCATNMKRPNAVGCANASASVQAGE
jgi:hypothetical protein